MRTGGGLFRCNAIPIIDVQQHGSFLESPSLPCVHVCFLVSSSAYPSFQSLVQYQTYCRGPCYVRPVPFQIEKAKISAFPTRGGSRADCPFVRCHRRFKEGA